MNMDREKMYYQRKYLTWIAKQQKHARELERENATLVFKPINVAESEQNNSV